MLANKKKKGVMKLSIIIPVYNVERFLKKCISSCESQDISKDDYEIIIVNDGSKDNSLEIAQSLAAVYSNILIFNQPNAGLSVARNEGLKRATGTYVWFVDSDDWIQENCLSSILNLCDSNSLDCLKFCAAYSCESDVKVRFRLPDKKLVTALEMMKMPQYSSCVPFAIYRRSFLLEKNLFFYPGIFHEDNEFTPRCLCEASRIMTLDRVLYYVYQNPNSITRSFNPKKADDLFVVANSLHNYSINKPRKIKQIISLFISSHLNSSLKLSQYMNDEQKKHLSTLFYNNRYLFVHFFHSRRLKYIVEGFFCFVFPKQLVTFFSFFRKLI